MGERDWAAEARERWPGCEAMMSGGVLYVAIGSVWRNAMQDKGGWWWSSTSTAQTPIAAIEAAIRAEQDEARATLARLAVWRVDQPRGRGRCWRGAAVTAPDVVELGRRAVACGVWRWMPGMLVARDEVWGPRAGVSVRVSVEASKDSFWLAEGWEPVVSDPATLGCLLALVREAWGDPTLSAAWAARRWYIVTPVRGVGFDALKAIDAPDELSALVAALEAAPVRS